MKCRLQYAGDLPEDALTFDTVKDAVEDFRHTATELDNYGQGIGAMLFKGDDVGEYPDYTLRLGAKGGVVMDRA